MRKVFLLLAWCSLGAGCSSLVPQLKTPDLKVVALNFVGGDARHQQLRLRIHVTNPNNRALAVREIDYQVMLGDTHFADGSSAAPFTVPASGETDFDLDVNADLESLIRVVGAHLGQPSLDYQVSGTLHLAAGLLREIPFKGHGQLPLQ
jgi:LEA14-like dessication related protein